MREDLPDHSGSNQLFPLPITAFERYMLADDHAGYPMTFVIEIRLSGDLCFDEFTNAYQQALARHPLLRAEIQRIRGRYYWTACEQINDIQKATESEQLEPNWQAINLREQPGVKIRVCQNEKGSRVSFLFHHAATDGIGAMRFIGDLLGHYGILTAKEGAEVPELAVYADDALKSRGQLWAADSVPDRSWKRSLKHLFEFLTNFSAGIARADSPLSQPTHRGFFVSRQLPRKALLQVKKLANQHGLTLNDLYLTCFLITMKAWNQSHGRSVEKECYRVLIPASLRTANHDQLSAANVLSFVLIHSRGKRIKVATAFVRELNRRMSAILNTADSRIPTRVFSLLSWIPGGLFLAVRSPVRFCSGVLTNVGEVKRQLNCRFPIRQGKCVAGSVVLESLYGAAPIRKGTALGVSLGTYAGELLINFICDSKVLPEDQSENFADLYLSQLNELVVTMQLERENDC